MILENTMAPDEVLEMCNISTQRLRDLNKSGRIVPIKRVGNANLYLRQDVERLRKELEENAKYKPDAYK
ncbi:DNA-binding protein [Paenibacillus larvae]